MASKKSLKIANKNVLGAWVGNGVYFRKPLPYGYVELPYIESTGNACFDTGYKPKSTTTISTEVVFTKTPHENGLLMGGSNYGTGSMFECYYWEGQLNLNYGWAGGLYPAAQFALNTKYQIDIKPTSAVLARNGTTTWSISYAQQSFTSSYNLTIFGLNRTGSVLYDKGGTRLYEMRIAEGTTFVRWYIPAMRESDYKAGLYDLVNNTFLTTTGSGMVYPIPTDYQQVEYLNINNAGFNNGYIPKIYSDDYMKFIFATTGTSTHVLFGSNYNTGQGYYLQSAVISGSLSLQMTGSWGNSISDGNFKNYTLRNWTESIPEASCSGTIWTTLGNLLKNNTRSITFGAQVPTAGGSAIINGKFKYACYREHEVDYKVAMIPCYRKSDNKAGVFDIPTQTFITDQRGGSVSYVNPITPASWHTVWTGTNDGALNPSGSYSEGYLTNITNIPSGTSRVRVTGQLIYADAVNQTVEKTINFVSSDITTTSWQTISIVMQERNATGSANACWNGGTTLQMAVSGTAYYPYTIIFRATKVEAYY